MSNKPTVAIVYGGKSAEYEVSIQTAYSVINAIDKEKYRVIPIHITNHGRWIEGREITQALSYKEQLLLDESRMAPVKNEWLTPMKMTSVKDKPAIVFPLLHGPNGEDGTVQGLFELLDIAYVGSGVAGSAVAMDKVIMKDLFTAHGIRQAAFVSVEKHEWDSDKEHVKLQVTEKLEFPCYVKPANLGSSIGISACYDDSALEGAIHTALKYDHKLVIEEKINGREIEIGVIGNENLSVSVPGEIKTEGSDFYDYQSKYREGNASLIIPADLDNAVLNELTSTAQQAFKVLNCSGLARVDFFVDNDEVILNEVNTMPGFTPYSMFPLLWHHTGVEYPELINRLIRLGLDRFQTRRDINYRIT